MTKGPGLVGGAALLILLGGVGVVLFHRGSGAERTPSRTEVPVSGEHRAARPTPPTTAAASAPASIHGVVLRGASTAPESGRSVTLLRDGDAPRTATTDAWGRFAFDGVAAGGPCEVRVEADGCAPVRVPGIALLPGERRSLGNLVLDLPARIVVDVFGPTGAPVTGASVEAYRSPTGVASDAVLLGVATPAVPAVVGTTDDAGRVTLDVARHAAWTVVARAPGHARRARAAMGFPEGRSERFTRFTLPRAERLTGRVVGADGRPVGSAIVVVRPRPEITDSYHGTRASSDAMWTRTVADAGGRFVVDGLPPGETEILAGSPGRTPAFALTVSVPDVADVDVPLPPTATLAGRVTDAASGAPIVGALVGVQSGWLSTAASATTDANGLWRVAGVAATSDVQVQVHGPRGTLGESLYIDGDGPESVRSGETRTIDVALFRDAVVTGVVTLDGERVAGADVRVVTFAADFDRVVEIAFGRSAADGRYEIDGVRPGPVAVYASAPGDDSYASYGEWFRSVESDPAARALLVFQAAPDAALTRDVVATLRPDEDRGAMERTVREMTKDDVGVVVRGRVTTADGVPLLDAEVSVDPYGFERLRGGGGQSTWPPVDLGRPVDPDGTFEQRIDVDPGEGAFSVYAFDARHDLTTIEDIPLPAGRSEVTVDVVLRERPLLRGLVVAGGAPVAGASIFWGRTVVALSHADGTFEARLPSGTWPLGVAAPGCVRRSFGDVVSPHDGVCTFELERARPLSGRVVDAAGRPRRGALVRPVDEDGDTVAPYDDWWHSPPPAAAVTDADGRFVLDEVGAAPQRLRIESLPGAPAPVAAFTTGPLDTGAPEARIVAADGRSVAGRVTGPDGRGLAGVRVVLSRTWSGEDGDEYDGTEWTRSTDETGAFAFDGLPDGTYDADVDPPRRAELVPVSREFAAGATGLDIRLERAAEISGLVVFADGRPVERAEVVLKRIDDRGPGERPWKDDMDDHTDAHGAFRILVPPRARFRAAFARNSNVADKAILHGGDDLPSGATGLRLVADTGLRIAGAVTDPEGRPIVGADVEVRTPDGSVRRDRTDAFGSFAVAGMESGVRGSVIVHADGFVPQRRRDVAAGTEDARVVLPPGTSIRGRLLRADGSRVKDRWRVRVLRPSERDADLWRAEIAKDGSFEVRGLDAGHWELEALVEGCMTIEECVPLGTFDAGASGLELRLPEGK